MTPKEIKLKVDGVDNRFFLIKKKFRLESVSKLIVKLLYFREFDEVLLLLHNTLSTLKIGFVAPKQVLKRKPANIHFTQLVKHIRSERERDRDRERERDHIGKPQCRKIVSDSSGTLLLNLMLCSKFCPRWYISDTNINLSSVALQAFQKSPRFNHLHQAVTFPTQLLLVHEIFLCRLQVCGRFAQNKRFCETNHLLHENALRNHVI